MRSRVYSICISMAILAAGSSGFAQKEGDVHKIALAKLGSTVNVHAFGKTLLCGQPSEAEFAQAKQRGITAVINLRMDGEISWNEDAVVRQLGMEYHHIPFRSPDSLTDEVFDKVRAVLKNADKEPVLMHCGSANRVGAVWLAHRVLDGGLTPERATKEAKEIGLRVDAYRENALDYIRRNK